MLTFTGRDIGPGIYKYSFIPLESKYNADKSPLDLVYDAPLRLRNIL